MKTLTNILEDLEFKYPDLGALLRSDEHNIFESAAQTRVPASTKLFSESEKCKNFMWLLDGTVRVFKNSSSGREVTLYRVNPGDLCVLSLQCLLSGDQFPAEAIAETDLFGLALSQPDFDQAIDNSKIFQRYILKFLSQRIGTLVQLVSEVTFQRLECRLSWTLGQLFERSGDKPLSITHVQLAKELGTMREVISRILKVFEHHGCILLSRGKISLVSRKNLEQVSQ